MKTKQLPEGWQEVELRDVIECVENGNRPKGGVGGIIEGVPSIGGEHINKFGGFNFTNLRFVSEKFYRREKRGHIKKEDVLVVKDGATTGRTTFVSEETFPYKKALVNEHVFILRPKNYIVESKFLFYYLYGTKGQKQILDNFHGSAQGGINTQFVKSVKVPIPFINGKPDLYTQKAIVSILEKAESLKQKRKEADNLTKEYLKNVFYEMFGNKSEVKNLKEVCDIIMGQSPPGNSYNETGKGTPFFQGKSEFTEKYPIVKKWTTEPTKIAIPNSILISIRAPVGSVNLCNIKCCIGRGLASIVPRKEVKLEYVYSWFKLNEKNISDMGMGSTFKAVSSTQLSNLQIPIPSLDLQQKFASIAEQVEKLKEKQKQSKEKIDEIFNSLMQKAFNGELVR